MTTKTRKLLTACLLIFGMFGFWGSGLSHAQNAETTTPAHNEALPESAIVKDAVTRPSEDEYVEPSLRNLSKMYWALGKFDLADDKLIDYYLMINECDMYLKYYHDDFQWDQIRDATRQHISKNMGQFPTRFELMSSISLGRYDLEREEFELSQDSKLSSMKRLDVAQNLLTYKKICVKSGEVYEYPANIVVVLNRPLTIEKFPVKRELVKLYLEEAKSFYSKLPPDLQNKRYERVAFLRLKIKVNQYKDTVRVGNTGLRAVVFGAVEGYEIYADQDKLKPLYEQKMEIGRFRRIQESGAPADQEPPPATATNPVKTP